VFGTQPEQHLGKQQKSLSPVVSSRSPANVSVAAGATDENLSAISVAQAMGGLNVMEIGTCAPTLSASVLGL